MTRATFFIDGFNLYHSIDSNKKYHKYKWLNLKKLCECFISRNEQINAIKYFTAFSHWKPDSMRRHKLYVEALRYTGIDIVFGAFREKEQKCPHCKKSYIAHREKRTDVNIAINLFVDAMLDSYDKAIIISGDSDLVPAISSLRSNFPHKRIGVVIPIGRRAEELKNIAHFHMKLKEKHLKSSEFDDVIDIGNNKYLTRPQNWN